MIMALRRFGPDEMASDLRAFEAELLRGLSSLERHTRFVEVLAERSGGTVLSLDSRSITPSRDPRMMGAVFRAWGHGRWVEAATSSLDAPSVTSATEALSGMLAGGGSNSGPPGVSSTAKYEWVDRPTHPVTTMDTPEAIALARDALGWAKQVPGVQECSVLLGWNLEERFYLNTTGARVYHKLDRVRANVVPLARENGKTEFDLLAVGAVGGREVYDFITEESVKEAAKNATIALHAGTPPTGEMEVLLDPSTSGTFAHESFGHGTEADQFLRNRSYLKPLLGATVGPSFLTLADDGAYPGGWGTIFSDDEGHQCQKTLLVDHGKFVGALHDRETAAAFHVPATGNTRRSDFLSRAFVRMTNTYVEPGDWKFEELVREVKHGVLMERATSGIEDPQGGQMQLKVKKGRRIENGQLGEVVSSMALSGKVLDFLKAIRGVSGESDFKIDPGYCGKGQSDLLPAGTGGTYLLSTAVVGPA
jgi:TldD protein